MKHYEALDVASDASQESIRTAYRAAVLRLHPDKVASETGQKDWQRTAEFLRVQQAWEVTHHQIEI